MDDEMSLTGSLTDEWSEEDVLEERVDRFTTIICSLDDTVRAMWDDELSDEKFPDVETKIRDMWRQNWYREALRAFRTAVYIGFKNNHFNETTPMYRFPHASILRHVAEVVPEINDYV